MTDQQKQEIKAKLSAYVIRYDSQNKAANSLSKVSAATISQVLNDNWDKISDEMWRNIGAQIGARQWEAIETSFYTAFTKLLDDARRHSFAYAITAEAGSGKSFTAAHYATTHANVYHITCNEMWSLRAFLREILQKLGIDQRFSQTDNVAMLGNIVSTLKKSDLPQIILDEADKLRPSILYSLISLINSVEGYCSVVICATPHLDAKITRGVELNRLGYNELYSRFGRRFINVKRCNERDIVSICIANGITDADQHAEITNGCDLDLRRVKRLIHAIKNR